MRKAELNPDQFTIACIACKKPLWHVEIIKRLPDGTPMSTDIAHFPGVKPYKKHWRGTELIDPQCPFCKEPFMKAIMAKGKLFPKLYCPEVDDEI